MAGRPGLIKEAEAVYSQHINRETGKPRITKKEAMVVAIGNKFDALENRIQQLEKYVNNHQQEID